VLDLDYFGLSEADLDTEFFTGSRTEAVPKRMKLREILAQLEFIYGGPIGAEFAHVSDSTERLWLQDQFQSGRLQGGPGLRHIALHPGYLLEPAASVLPELFVQHRQS